MTESGRAAAAKVNASRAHSLDKTANIIESTAIRRAQISACFWSCRCLIVLISKLALLYLGQEPILIEKIFFLNFIKKRKDRPAHSSINVHWEGAQKPIVCTEVGEAAWKAGGAVRAHLYMREGEKVSSRLFCCPTAWHPADVFLLTWPAAALLWASSPNDSFTHKAVCSLAHNGLINALMMLDIFFHNFPLFQPCYRIQMNAGPIEVILNVKMKNITALAAQASFRSCLTGSLYF